MPKSLFKEASQTTLSISAYQPLYRSLITSLHLGDVQTHSEKALSHLLQTEVTVPRLFQMYNMSTSPLLFLYQPLFFSPKNQRSDLLHFPGFWLCLASNLFNIYCYIYYYCYSPNIIYLQTRDYSSPGPHWQSLPGRRDIFPPLHWTKTTSVRKIIILQQFSSTTNSLLLILR